MSDLNQLIGIPFKLNKRDFTGCDCRGIVWLYYKQIKNRILPPITDGGRIWLRNRHRDTERLINILYTIATPVTFDDLDEGDIVVLKSVYGYGALGVCINNKQVLHMDKFIGSCLTRLRYVKDMFIIGFRPL